MVITAITRETAQPKAISAIAHPGMGASFSSLLCPSLSLTSRAISFPGPGFLIFTSVELCRISVVDTVGFFPVVEDVPEVFMVEDAPAVVMVNNIPAVVMVEDVPAVVMVEDVPAVVMVEDVPAVVMVEDVPAVVMAKDNPGLVENTVKRESNIVRCININIFEIPKWAWPVGNLNDGN